MPTFTIRQTYRAVESWSVEAKNAKIALRKFEAGKAGERESDEYLNVERIDILNEDGEVVLIDANE